MVWAVVAQCKALAGTGVRTREVGFCIDKYVHEHVTMIQWDNSEVWLAINILRNY